MPSIHPASLALAAESIAIYESAPPGTRQYRALRRLWSESWASAYHVPRYATVEAGRAGLRNQAALLGGDAIVNFACYDNPRDVAGSWHSPLTSPRAVPRALATAPAALPYTQVAFTCNGTVIKYAN